MKLLNLSIDDLKFLTSHKLLIEDNIDIIMDEFLRKADRDQ